MQIHEEIHRIQEALRLSFRDVRLEMDDHLSALNENSSEIGMLQNQLREFDKKLDKLTDRVDELASIIQPQSSDFSNIQLNSREQEVFMVLYATEGPLTPDQVGKMLGLSRQLAAQYLYNLQLKGVPMIARNWKGELFYSLDLKFKDLQARKNVLRISTSVQERLGNMLN